MKSNLMRAPVISQIYTQKVTYENHLKKLDKIREERKNQLHFDQTRNSQIRQIKDSKSKSFAHKFNEHNLQINQHNVKLLTKLQKVRPFTRYPSHTTYDKPLKDNNNNSFIKPINKRKIIQTQKQNSRIFIKMKSVSSTLSKDKMMDEYYKAQQIKSRITKYAFQNNKVALKSEKYFSQNKSIISSRSIDSKTEREKTNLVSYYNRDDIIKNRISSTDHRLNKINKDKRIFPALNHTLGNHQPPQSQEKVGIFATEAENSKVKRSVSQKRPYK